jgi:hypothetical protein
VGDIHAPEPVLQIIAAFSRYDAALDWTATTIADRFGAIALTSPRFDFRETDYYQTTMGDSLRKVFFACAESADPAALVDWKHATNSWEAEYAGQANHQELRPLNLDPGYISLGKLVLASTKDHAHRIYMAQGIYAEVTLRYSAKRWQTQPWTYPDYQRADFQAFFGECRQYLRTISPR